MTDKNRIYSSSGTITVFLSLTLLVMISLITVVVESARERSMRMRIEMAMDMGMQSVFAEYNKALLEEFDLYFIDSSYGNDNGDAYYTAQRFKNYMDYNLNPVKGQMLVLSRDLFGLSADSVNVNMETRATDSGGRVFKRQAIQYIKDKYGMSIVEEMSKVKADYEQYEMEDYDVATRREENAKKLKKADDACDDEGEKIEYTNPADKVEKSRSGVLNILLEKEVSDRTLKLSSRLSERHLKAGDGIVGAGDLDDIKSDILFGMYINDKFSSYVNDVGRNGLHYEIEYILNGEKSDKDNLRKTVEKLLLIRETANCMYIFDDETITEQAKAVAEIIAALIEMPELEEPFEYSILFAWAFAESCVDVRTLLDGGKVPIMKDAGNWNLKTIADAVTFKAHLNDGIKNNSGLDYRIYMQLLLLMEKDRDKIYRSMDMIENDLHYIVGNESLKMDECIEFMELEANVSSAYGRNFSIVRSFGYMYER